MSLQKKSQKKIAIRTTRRTFRVRNSQGSRSLKPRVCVFRSLNQIYSQIIDDSTGSVLASYSSLQLKNAKGDKTDVAKLVGLELGKVALSKSVKEAFFDRGRYLYHGRVKALVEGLRESGMQI